MWILSRRNMSYCHQLIFLISTPSKHLVTSENSSSSTGEPASSPWITSSPTTSFSAACIFEFFKTGWNTTSAWRIPRTYYSPPTSIQSSCSLFSSWSLSCWLFIMLKSSMDAMVLRCSGTTYCTLTSRSCWHQYPSTLQMRMTIMRIILQRRAWSCTML